MTCFFTSDLHGQIPRYEALVSAIEKEVPDAVFLGGDLLPGLFQLQYKGQREAGDFVLDYLIPAFRDLKRVLGSCYPAIFPILGNDDSLIEEKRFMEAADIWCYMHMNKVCWSAYDVYGYAIVPPTPFPNKDWERYDVSRYVDPGCIHPTEGFRSMEPATDIKYATIATDLRRLVGDAFLDRSIMLMHAPPYESSLDRAALDGKCVDYVPLDVHVGSIAIKRFIMEKQPLLTLHGHVHESTSLTGEWKQQFGRTWSFNGAHHGPELSLIRFDLDNLATATRELITPSH